ncbi:N-acetylmuramoyl-L-alanine amidase [Nocardia wallacei]|uniref:N-acetylmuramoyl-L-alanine amidase n=1 Tax=Nocardia wallacei TaxID=480035 RepID=UPI002456E5E0|nr:N-acetylmuramoyl-L-alanine amidase [Nocardia wallacei]
MKPSIVKAGLCLAVTAAALAPSAGMLPAVAVAAPADPDMSSKLAGKTVFLDPGHQGSDHNQDISRPVGDGRGGTKECQTTGMTTVNGVPEHTITWNVSQLVKQSLEAMGARVVLSRQDDTGWGSCIDERAAAANDSGADVAISIHADGAPASERGFHLIVPQLPIPDPTANQVQSGAGLAATKVVRDAYLQAGFPAATYGGAVDGLQTRADIAGPALTRVPDVFLEMGNGANAEDAAELESREGQLEHAVAIATGLTGYLLGFGAPPLPSGSADGRASANTPPGQENPLTNDGPADAVQGTAPGRSSTTAPGAAAQSAPDGSARSAPDASTPGADQTSSGATPPGASAHSAPGAGQARPDASAQSVPGTEQTAPDASAQTGPGADQIAPGGVAPGASAQAVPGAEQTAPGVSASGASAQAVPGTEQTAPGVSASGASAQAVPGAEQTAPGGGASGSSAHAAPGTGQSAAGAETPGVSAQTGPGADRSGRSAASASADPGAGQVAPGAAAQGSGESASGAAPPNANAQHVPGSYTPGTPDGNAQAPGPGSPNAYTTPNAYTSPDAYAPGAPRATAPGNSATAPPSAPGTAPGSDPSTTSDSAASSLVTTAMQLLLPLAKSLGMDDAAVNSELINLAYTLAATLLGPGSSESSGAQGSPGAKSIPGTHSGPAAR